MLLLGHPAKLIRKQKRHTKCIKSVGVVQMIHLVVDHGAGPIKGATSHVHIRKDIGTGLSVGVEIGTRKGEPVGLRDPVVPSRP